MNQYKKISFTIKADAKAKVLLLQLQEILKLQKAPEKPTQGDVVYEALKELAAKTDFEKLKGKYKRHIKHITEDYVTNKGK